MASMHRAQGTGFAASALVEERPSNAISLWPIWQRGVLSIGLEKTWVIQAVG